MKNRIALAGFVGTLALAAAACNSSSPGGPGASGGSAANTPTTFKLTGPTLSTTVKQGETDTVKLSISRGKDFKQSVAISTDAPKGLTVKLNSSKVAASDPEDFTFTVSADKDAPLGEQTIKVTGKPETGESTSVDVKINVTEGPKT